jgi:hypothetical protein
MLLTSVSKKDEQFSSMLKNHKVLDKNQAASLAATGDSSSPSSE